MNVYEASILLSVWPVVKARAEIWLTAKPSESMWNGFKDIIKNRYRELSLVHHPDMGGDHDTYIKIQRAYEVLRYSALEDIVEALSYEKKMIAEYCKPGSDKCKNCSKWSKMINLCATISCTGFEINSSPNYGHLKQEQSGAY